MCVYERKHLDLILCLQVSVGFLDMSVVIVQSSTDQSTCWQVSVGLLDMSYSHCSEQYRPEHRIMWPVLTKMEDLKVHDFISKLLPDLYCSDY